jgi:hypothetical protein
MRFYSNLSSLASHGMDLQQGKLLIFFSNRLIRNFLQLNKLQFCPKLDYLCSINSIQISRRNL